MDLKQLLNQCGVGFRSLSLHSDGRWIAKAGHNALPTHKLFKGKTAEEALYKLMVAILEKQERERIVRRIEENDHFK
jgi:hypothetical protein